MTTRALWADPGLIGVSILPVAEGTAGPALVATTVVDDVVVAIVTGADGADGADAVAD